ncbi:hypothetical protein DRQ05_04075 [bacterium]|nr:MAG: hypothetical protein DRQ05_04075 [bacterium]
MMKRLFVILLGVFLLLSSALRADEGSGGTGSIFRIGAGSRAISLGGAFTAVGDDPSVLFYNPAALRLNKYPRVMLNHIQLFSNFSDAAYDFAGIVYPSARAGAIGLGFLTVGTGGIRAFDEFSRETGEISYRESEGILSYAVKLPWDYFGHFTVGSSIKVLNQRVGDYSDTGTGLDIGFLYEPPYIEHLILGCNLQDIIGAETKLVSVSERVDRTLMFGAGYRYVFSNGSSLILSSQLNAPKRDDKEIRFGAEFIFKNMFAVRFGYDSEQITAGLGFGLRGFQLDYGYFSRQDVGASHPITLSANIGSSVDERLRLAEERKKREEEEYVRKVFATKVSKHIEEARKLSASDEFENALDELKIALEYDPNNKEAKRLLDDVKKKIISLQEERTKTQEKAILINQHFKLGLKYYSSNDYLLAKAEWKNVLELDPQNKKAKEYLDKTVAKLNEQISIHRLKALELEKRGKLTAALSEWNLIKMLEPENAEAKDSIERITVKLDKLRKQYKVTAEKLKAVQLFEEAAKAFGEGRYNRSIDLLRELLLLDPQHVEARKLMARAKRKITPLTDEEKQRIKQLYIAGMKSFTQDRYEEAIAQWRKILLIDPDNESVIENIKEARDRLSRMQSQGEGK